MVESRGTNILNKSKIAVILLMSVLLISLSVSLVAAQYQTEKTTNIAISSDGTFVVNEPDVGISYEIQGTPYAVGSVTASIYNGNPQPSALCPDGISLSHFIGITFNINPGDFNNAKIVISYSSSDVQGISAPYAIYKYNPDSNSFVEVPAALDTTAKTITVTVASISDPLFAIGGTAAKSGGIPASSWAILAVAIIVILVLVVVVVSRLRTRVEK